MDRGGNIFEGKCSSSALEGWRAEKDTKKGAAFSRSLLFIDDPVNRDIHQLLLVRALVFWTVLRTLRACLWAVRVLRSLLGTGLGGAVHIL